LKREIALRATYGTSKIYASRYENGGNYSKTMQVKELEVGQGNQEDGRGMAKGQYLDFRS
jgi:hypothetical protein